MTDKFLHVRKHERLCSHQGSAAQLQARRMLPVELLKRDEESAQLRRKSCTVLRTAVRAEGAALAREEERIAVDLRAAVQAALIALLQPRR